MRPVEAIFRILDAIRDEIRDDAGPFDVLDAIRPILFELVQHESVLTADRRDALQSRVLDTLYEAGLLPTADLEE